MGSADASALPNARPRGDVNTSNQASTTSMAAVALAAAAKTAVTAVGEKRRQHEQRDQAEVEAHPGTAVVVGDQVPRQRAPQLACEQRAREAAADDRDVERQPFHSASRIARP